MRERGGMGLVYARVSVCEEKGWYEWGGVYVRVMHILWINSYLMD